MELQDGVILLVSLLQGHDSCLVIYGKLFQDVELGGGKTFNVELYDGKAEKDMCCLHWWLKLSWLKMVSATFHLNNVTLDGKCLSFTQIQTYLGVKLNRSLTYH